MTQEQWRDIAGYEGAYQVSDMGRVRVLNRAGRDGRVLKLGSAKGYPKVNLSKDGLKRTRMVHQLVLEAFVAPCPEGLECCHNDGDRTNSRLPNLRWDTKKSNSDDKRVHGVAPLGSRNGCAKLTERDVRAIRCDTRKQKAVAACFGVATNTVSRIKRRVSWAHVGGKDDE